MSGAAHAGTPKAFSAGQAAVGQTFPRRIDVVKTGNDVMTLE